MSDLSDKFISDYSIQQLNHDLKSTEGNPVGQQNNSGAPRVKRPI